MRAEAASNSNSTATMASSTAVKKLRLLLQAGAELGAVEQKAKLEGVDMKLVLSPSSMQQQHAADDDDNVNGKNKTIPETLIKKYKRMLKAGLPMNRVQQLAGVEAGVTPEEVEHILLKKDDTVGNAAEAFIKFVRMQKAGIPLAAIQNSARIQGVNVDELNAVLVLARGGDDDNNTLTVGQEVVQVDKRDDEAAAAS
eukprot:scaffold36344_cov56-Cyclotella_meneghiniana.AAC.7